MSIAAFIIIAGIAGAAITALILSVDYLPAADRTDWDAHVDAALDVAHDGQLYVPEAWDRGVTR